MFIIQSKILGLTLKTQAWLSSKSSWLYYDALFIVIQTIQPTMFYERVDF